MVAVLLAKKKHFDLSASQLHYKKGAFQCWSENTQYLSIMAFKQWVSLSKSFHVNNYTPKLIRITSLLNVYESEGLVQGFQTCRQRVGFSYNFSILYKFSIHDTC